jgi:hypothetical protein
MTRDEATAIVRALLPCLGGHPKSYVAVPIEVLEVLLREPALGVTPLADIEVAAVLDFGARKHAGELVEEFHAASQVAITHHVAKALSHLARYQRGETADAETGLRTLAHVAARALLAAELDLRGAH